MEQRIKRAVESERTIQRHEQPVRGLRVAARFSVLVGLTLSILAGFGVRRVLGWCRSSRARWSAISVLASLVVIDAWPALPLVPVWKQPPAIYDTLKTTPGVVLAEFPVDMNDVFNTPYMYFSVWHFLPMVNGYSGHIPASYTTLVPELLEFPRADSAAALRRRGVTHVTVNCGLQSADCDETMTVMRQSPDLRLIGETSWEGEPVRLFELTAH